MTAITTSTTYFNTLATTTTKLILPLVLHT